MRSTLLAAFVALLMCFLATPSARAQGVGASGGIRGTVTDATGAVITKTAVEALDVARGQRYDTLTDANGQYQFASLPPATYSISATISGFQTETQTGLVLNIGQVAVVDFPSPGRELVIRSERGAPSEVANWRAVRRER